MDIQSSPPFFHKIQLFPFPIFIKRELSCALSFLLLFLSFLLFLHFISPFQPQSLLGNIGFLSQILPNNQNSVSEEACDYSNGRWVRDESYRLRYSEDCPFLDPGFRCRRNGRRDEDYLNWRWQPNGCDLPRFNASEFLERSRNGRIVFAGDSIGRNQWESLLCMLAKAVQNKSTIYEENGKPITRHKGYLSVRFDDYNLTVEYYRAPFLVTIDRPPQNSSKQVHSAIRVDQLQWRSNRWVGADVLIFNAGHWWNKEKTIKMGYYFQEGGELNITMSVVEAFSRSLQTLKSWVTQNLDTEKSHVFFRSYSPVHYRNGTWNDGGRCDTNSEPVTEFTELIGEPWNNLVISNTVEQMDTNRKVQFLNITYLTELRNDGHPSIHREPGTPVPFPQDCSHWCLPGVPDTWNELLYAYLLLKDYRTKNA